MVNKILKGIIIFFVRVFGIVTALVSIGIIVKSVALCENLGMILSIGYQVDLSVWRLIGLFCLNGFGLLFAWSIALMLLIMGITMIKYKSTIVQDMVEHEF